jgi:DNA-binding LytR/AlgR family response regulator
MAPVSRKVLLHLQDGRRVPLEPEEVFYLEAAGDETVDRTRGRRRLQDVRSLGGVAERFPAGTLVPIHRSIAVKSGGG